MILKALMVLCTHRMSHSLNSLKGVIWGKIQGNTIKLLRRILGV